MNMVVALMTGALRALDARVTTQSLYGTTSEVVRFCEKVKRRPLRSCLESYGLPCPDNLDGWTLPDGVWSAICRQRPQLNGYPLGEIAERAVKKTVAELTLKSDAHGPAQASPNVNKGQILGNLRRSIKALGTEGLVKLFLSQYFFELCIDYLRRSRDDSRLDYGFWYHFSRDGYFVSLAAEREVRDTLAKQCEEKAELFLPFLAECLEEQDSAWIEQRISEGLAQTFGMSPPIGRGTENPNKPFVNVIVGSKLPPGGPSHFSVGARRRRLLLHTKRPNVSFSFDALEKSLGHRIHSLVRDLLDIGAVVYMSDLYTKRQPHLGRRMGILMRARHPDIWSGAGAELERAVSFLGRDDFSIHFVKGAGSANRLRRFPVKSDDRCVCLLSGGLDSVAGAVWAIEKGLTPIFVSHYAAGQLAGIQNRLVARLEQIYNRKLPHMSVRVSTAWGKNVQYQLPGPLGGITAQHLRSFLFLSLASAVALELGISKVYIFENGPVALNPLFSEARVNTRTAHPHFLAYFRELIKAVFGVDLTIENPFLYRAKGEVADILARPELEGLVAMTNSCWYWFKVLVMAKDRGISGFKGNHDGECLPCVLRRTAVHHAGLWEKDAAYLTDVLNEFPALPDREIITAIADFLRFCQNVKTLSDADLLFRAPDFSVYAKATDPQELLAMYRRHSEEVMHCFRDKSNDTFRKVFASALEE